VTVKCTYAQFVIGACTINSRYDDDDDDDDDHKAINSIHLITITMMNIDDVHGGYRGFEQHCEFVLLLSLNFHIFCGNS